MPGDCGLEFADVARGLNIAPGSGGVLGDGIQVRESAVGEAEFGHGLARWQGKAALGADVLVCK